jgi:FKBP-type peptidyl-prolyl cis-trans isomerase SlyD
VKKVEDEEVTIDDNHPLAGVTLNFDIKIVNVREATEEEIAHGHVH